MWTGSAERRGFLDVVAAVPTVAEPVTAFLALDARLDDAIVGDAARAGIPILERDEATPIATLAARLIAALGIAGR